MLIVGNSVDHFFPKIMMIWDIRESDRIKKLYRFTRKKLKIIDRKLNYGQNELKNFA